MLLGAVESSPLLYIESKTKMFEKEDKKSLAELGVSQTPNYHEGKAVYINESRLYRFGT